jgi:hypothetical protein
VCSKGVALKQKGPRCGVGAWRRRDLGSEDSGEQGHDTERHGSRSSGVA